MNSFSNGINYLNPTHSALSHAAGESRPGAFTETGAMGAIYRSVVEAVAKLCEAEMAGISVAGKLGIMHHVLYGRAESETTAGDLTQCAGMTLNSTLHSHDHAIDDAPNPIDLGGPLRFYAGVPLFDADGAKLGVFFIAGAAPRILNCHQSNTLRELGRHVAALMQSEAVHCLSSTTAASDLRIAHAATTASEAHALTQYLPDRALFEKQLAHFMHANNMQDQLFAVMSLHIDNFEDIAYTLGDDTGRALLLQVAERLRNNLYIKDLIGHGDGSHFLLVIQDLERAKDIDAVVKKVTEKCAQPFAIEGQNIFITLSIGTTLSAFNSDLPSVLMRYADTAMHLAVKGGGNSHLQFRLEMHNQILEQTRIASDLTFALAADQFELYYQAKVNIVTGKTSGFEALLRWHHPERGMVSPIDFIPVLEQTGLIVPVGELVIRKACRQLNAWRAAGMTLVPIAINLSARQFESPLLLASIETCLAQYDIPPSLLELEITESALMRDVENATRQLQNFSDMGLKIAVDDFGTGYSSLAYLRYFPIDALKIDKTFVQGIGINHGDTEITRTVIDLAHSLGLKVIAEGVENQKQLAFLTEHACDEVQGFYFSRPVSAKQCEPFLEEGLYEKYRAAAECIAA